MVVVHHAPADVGVVHNLVPVFAGAEAAVGRRVAVVLATEQDAVGTSAQVAFAREDTQFEDGLGAVLLRPGSNPLARRIKLVDAAVDDVGKSRGSRGVVVHIHIDLTQDGLVRVVVDVAEDLLLGQQRGRRVQVGENLGIDLFHRVALELGTGVDGFRDHGDAEGRLVHIVRLAVHTHQVEVHQGAGGIGLAEDVVETGGSGSFRLEFFDIDDDVVGLKQAVVYLRPDAEVGVRDLRVGEIVHIRTRVAGRVDGEVTAPGIAEEHKVLAVVARRGHFAHQAVHHNLGIRLTGDAGRRVRLVARGDIQETFAGNERQRAEERKDDCYFFHCSFLL